MKIKRLCSSALATVILLGSFATTVNADNIDSTDINNNTKQAMELTLNPNEPTIKIMTNSYGEQVEVGTQMVWSDSKESRLWWDKDIPTGNSRWRIWIDNSLIGGVYIEYYINVNKTSASSRPSIKSYDSDIIRYLPGDLKSAKMVRYNSYKVWHEAQWLSKNVVGNPVTKSGRLGSEITTAGKLNCWVE